MTKSRSHVVTASARVAASPERIYSIIANYRDGHPRILPKEFVGLWVEKGGIGAGTIIRVQMRFLGTRREFRAAITDYVRELALLEALATES